MIDLKPCPFCGEVEKLFVESSRDKYDEHSSSGHWVFCPKCKAEGPWNLGESGAIEAWNKRIVNNRRNNEPSSKETT